MLRFLQDSCLDSFRIPVQIPSIVYKYQQISPANFGKVSCRFRQAFLADSDRSCRLPSDSGKTLLQIRVEFCSKFTQKSPAEQSKNVLQIPIEMFRKFQQQSSLISSRNLLKILVEIFCKVQLKSSTDFSKNLPDSSRHLLKKIKISYRFEQKSFEHTREISWKFPQKCSVSSKNLLQIRVLPQIRVGTSKNSRYSGVC